MSAGALRDAGSRRADRHAHGRIRNSVPRDRSVAFFTYVAAVTVAAAFAVGPALADLPDLEGLTPAFWVIAVLGVVVDVRAFPTVGTHRSAIVYPSIAFTFALLLGWGLAPAVVVQSLAVVVSSIRLRHAPWRALFNISQYAVSFAAAALVLSLTDSPRLSGLSVADGGADAVVPVLAYLAAGLTWLVVNEMLVVTAIWLRFRGSLIATLTRTLRPDVLASLSLLAFAPLIVAAGNVSALLVPLTLVPLVAVNDLARFSEEEQRSLVRDDLTGLPNRKALYSEIRAQARTFGATRQRSEDQRRMALLLLDIDQFRRVNDALGHTVGDRLLVAVAERLSATIGADGIVARLGGDEFAVLAPRVQDQTAANVLAERVADALVEPVTLDGLPLEVTAAIGVAVHPDHGTEITTLLRHAEVAMYDAKDRGARYAVYTSESDQNSPERLELMADLRRALELGRPDEIRLFYQPQVELGSGDVVGVEALLRWHHPRRGIVSPDHLIKIAERTAVMRLLTSRILEDAIIQLAKWRARGLVLRTSVNVSVRDLHRPDFADYLAKLLSDHEVPPSHVQLEITEGALMADPRRVLVTLHRLDTLGVALSLDDFGTGYSSLQHLRRLPLAEVKIDRSFVLGMATDPDDAAVVGSIIDLARALGLRVVAEGVEDDSTRRMLQSGGCEVAQGWYFARPMPADELVTWLARYRLPEYGLEADS
jgi:diguanylate cyclase (GGDEF)-like protein